MEYSRLRLFAGSVITGKERSKFMINNSSNSKNTAAKVTELIAPIAAEMGYILWDVEFVKEGSRHILRVTLDKQGGVNIDDCERFHRAIDPVLDEADPIEISYYLEVSSPGIERELKTPEHIRACQGQDVDVRFYAPVDGSKSCSGILRGIDDNGFVMIELNGKTRGFDPAVIAKIRTRFDFGD